MPKDFIFLFDIDLVKSNFEKITKLLERGEYTALALSDPVYLFFKSRNVDCLSHHDFETEGMYDDLYRTACHWGRNWYRPKGEDLTLSGGYSVGSIVEWCMIYFFSHFLRLYFTLEKIKEKTCAEKIFYFSAETKSSLDPEKLQYVDVSFLATMLRRFCEREMPDIDLNIEMASYTRSSRSRKYPLIRSACRMFNNIWNGVKKPFPSDRKKILFFEGASHFWEIMRSSELKGVNKVHLQKTIGPTLLGGLYSSGIKVFTLQDDRVGVTTDAGEFNSNRIKEELKEFFVHGDKNLLSYLWPRIEVILNKIFPEVVLKDINAASATIAKVRPDCVITENDTTYYEKMIVQVAKRHSIPTVVVQHGSTLYSDTSENEWAVTHPFYPLTCDTFLAYGKANRDWFKSMKVDPKKVVVTGSAKFDVYYDGKQNRGRPEQKKTVLVLLNDFWCNEGVVTNHIGLTVFYEHLQEFIKLAKEHPEANFEIRPHEEKHLWNEMFGNEIKKINNFSISREKSLKEVLRNVDLAIGYASTALIEALICRVPVISLDMEGYNNFFSLWKYDVAKRVSSFRQLEEEMTKILYDINKRDELLKMIDKNINIFNYKDDGLASHRIAEEINKIARRV